MKKYFSLVLFAHSIFALPFAIIGFFLAVNTTDHYFEWTSFILMLCCMVFARNAAMAFNRFLDRDIDAIIRVPQYGIYLPEKFLPMKHSFSP